MDIQAHIKYIRVSPRKMQLLVKSIKSMTPFRAIAALDYMPKKSSLPLRKAIESALANARNLNTENPKGLVFKSIEVLPGSFMKRFQAVSRGMAHEYKKRMCHLRIVLTSDVKVNDSSVALTKQAPEVVRDPKSILENKNINKIGKT